MAKQILETTKIQSYATNLEDLIIATGAHAEVAVNDEGNIVVMGDCDKCGDFEISRVSNINNWRVLWSVTEYDCGEVVRTFETMNLSSILLNK